MNRKRDDEAPDMREARAVATAELAMTLSKKERRKFIAALLKISENWKTAGNVVTLHQFLRPKEETRLLQEEAEVIHRAAELIALAEARQG